ncbi:MAG: flagellar protein [Lachnospiraceae bacterium]|jgi:flagellar operon protein|nr:flagellar protein [Lachnospiraceae bacterium]
MNLQNNQYLSALRLQEKLLNQTTPPPVAGQTPPKTEAGFSFREVLSREAVKNDDVRFSKHAKVRLADRGIDLSPEQINRLNEGTQRAGAKGIKESLVIIDQMAFIVNIPNNTVVTAMSGRDTGDNVFTNIDGAVII